MSSQSRRRKRKVHPDITNITVKQEPVDEGQKPLRASAISKASKKRPCKSQAVVFPMTIKRERIDPTTVKAARNRGAPVSIRPPDAGDNNDDGSLKVKFILSPKNNVESDEEEEEEEEEEVQQTASVKSKKEGLSKKSPGSLKLKFSFKTAPNVQSPKGKGKAIIKNNSADTARTVSENAKEDTFVHPKKRFRTSFEASEKVAQTSSVAYPGKKRGKPVKLDSDSGYSDAQSSAQAVLKMKQLNSSSVLGRNHPEVDKKREKKKKKRDKDKKKKFFKTKSDKNRFLNVHRSSDEAEDGWIEEKVVPMKVVPPIEYEVYTPVRAVPEAPALQPIKIKKEKRMKSKTKSKSRSKSKNRGRSRRKHGKKAKKLIHVDKKKKDKQTFTQEQIVKIQQRLMLQGLKSPSSGGDDFGELNFSSHGEDLISQLTASSGHFDPISLLEESAEELPVKRSVSKHADKKTDKSKLKDKKKKKKPLSAYMMWCKANRAKIVAQYKGLNFANVSRKLGELWHCLPEKEKTKWKHKQRSLMMRHKNVPSLSRLKKQSKQRMQYKFPPPQTQPIDVAAHLKLLGESLGNVGANLISHAGGEAEVHGSMSVLMDSMLSAIAPLLCLTSQVEELNTIRQKTQAQLLENIAYIMPGL